MSRAFEVPTAVISDIQGNLSALSAVLKDIDAQGIEEIVCLGGLVTFGPAPEAILATLRERVSVCLRGSYEDGLLRDPTRFNLRDQQALLWQQARLKPGLLARSKVRAQWKWLNALAVRYGRPGVLAVHGHPASPLWGHIPFAGLPSDEEIERCFESVEHVLFAGCLGRPFVFGEDGAIQSASELEGHLVLTSRKVAICPGSVGQPRDMDPRASYAIFDGETVKWRRVRYDIDEAVAALDASDLPGRETFAARLREGI